MKKFTFLSAILIFVCIMIQGVHAQEIDLSKNWKVKVGDDLNWANPSYNDKDWKPIETRKIFEDQGYTDLDGFIWYRTNVVIPSSLKNSAYLKDSLKIYLGFIGDDDQAYLNGQLIGQNGGLKKVPFDKAMAWLMERRYCIPANSPCILWDKENVIAVRVMNEEGGGGFYKGKTYVSMVDVNEYFKISIDINKQKMNSDNTVDNLLLLINKSTSLKMEGNLKIVLQENSLSQKKFFEKTINISVSPSKKDSLLVNLPFFENAVAVLTFVDTDSKKGIISRFELPYILTPKAPKTPKINGAKIYGVRPGNPFLFVIAASGLKPITFSAENLPTGLFIDKNTGIITGKISEKGEYVVKLTAENKLGKFSRDLRIVCGDKIALTPPMGWNSWNCWGLSVSEEKIKQSTDAFVSSGLIEHGWTYVNIDDGWELVHMRDSMVCNQKFPSMKNLSDYVHSKGLKMGIYSSPGPKTCGGYEGSFMYEEADARNFGAWGIDYIKYDWCSYGRVVYKTDTTLFRYKKPYFDMQAALKKVKRDIVYSLCQYGMGDVWKWGGEVGGNCWRTTGDIEDTWESMSGIGFSQNKCSPYTKPGNWNDPDMLVVGKVGWGPRLHNTKLTPNEQYTHISLWCLLASPLLIGCDLSQLDDFTLNLLTNDEVLDVDQDPLGKQAVQLVKNDKYEIWVKEMEDGSKAIGLFNKCELPEKITLNWKDLNISGKQLVRDLWRQKDLGKFDRLFETSVPGHGVVLVKVTAVK